MHQIEIVSEYNSFTGHAGSVVSPPDGRVEAASDARSDGFALAGKLVLYIEVSGYSTFQP